ncbi:MAG TPA: type II toxin-antitoxin system HicA family toxin [Verrucomicrobiae bacterium]
MIGAGPHPTAHGCVLIREGSDHSWWGSPASNRRSAVPRHSEINKFLAKKICRDLDVPAP